MGVYATLIFNVLKPRYPYMKCLSTVLFWCLGLFAVTAQSDSLRNHDFVYLPNIRAVQFHLDGLPLTNPILNLGAGGQLRLAFDDLNEDVMDYVYEIVHCDQDWTPSELDELDFLDGFNGERIEEYDFSYNTLRDYTHYDLWLPNEDVRWTVSGNYLIHVYEDDERRRPAITRRFMVTESIVRIASESVAPSQVSKFRTHQEIDFLVNHKGFEIRNPRQEITAVVLQNGRWDNAVTDLKPAFIKGEDLIFDFQNKIVFSAGKEHRFVDLRTFRYLTERMADIREEQTHYDVVLKKEGSRTFQNFRSYQDLNGKFVIEHLERPNGDIEGDYASVFFAVGVTQELFDTEVYLVGNFTDWLIKPEYKMVYNPAVGAYVGRVWLKQGFYDYLYVGLTEGSTEPDYETFEGNWHETENEYQILVYYRPFGQRFDRLIGVQTLSVNR